MAGRKLVMTKLKASTVLEVVISMVIIVVVFGIAMMIYTNVTHMSLSGQKIKAQAVLTKIMKDAEATGQPLEQEMTIDDLTIESSIKHDVQNDQLLEADLKAYDENHQLLAELRQLIIQKDDQ